MNDEALEFVETYVNVWKEYKNKGEDIPHNDQVFLAWDGIALLKRLEENKTNESANVKRMCECPNCKTLSPKVNENYEDIKAEGFDCPNCGTEFMTPLNSPLIVEVSE